jgi:ankyrin repeat protein
MKKVVDAGADVNLTTHANQSPLLVAASTGRTEMVEFLIGAGADVNIKDKDGNSPLSIARTKGFDGIVTLLEKAATQTGKK